MVNDLSGFCRSGVYGDNTNTFPLSAQAFQQHPFAANQIGAGFASGYPTNFGGQTPYGTFNQIPFNQIPFNPWNQIAQTNPFYQGAINQSAINPLCHPAYGVLMNSVLPYGCAPQFANTSFQQIPYGSQIPYGGQVPYQGHPLQTNAFSPFATSPFNNVWGFTPVACR